MLTNPTEKIWVVCHSGLVCFANNWWAIRIFHRCLLAIVDKFRCCNRRFGLSLWVSTVDVSGDMFGWSFYATTNM